MTPEKAISLARDVALTEGWRWITPVRASLHRRWFVGPRYWIVRTNDGIRGDCVIIELDDETAQVTYRLYLPR